MSDTSRRPPGHHLVSVYEAANDTLKEVYVGITTLLMERLVKGFQTSPPPAVACWKRKHRVLFRIVRYIIPYRKAAPFIRAYLQSGSLAGWKVLGKTDDPPLAPAGKSHRRKPRA